MDKDAALRAGTWGLTSVPSVAHCGLVAVWLRLEPGWLLSQLGHMSFVMAPLSSVAEGYRADCMKCQPDVRHLQAVQLALVPFKGTRFTWETEVEAYGVLRCLRERMAWSP